MIVTEVDAWFERIRGDVAGGRGGFEHRAHNCLG
jgi:hypothetical protein